MLATPKASPNLQHVADALVEAHGIRAVLFALAGLCEARAEALDNRTPGNSAAEHWARLAVWVDMAAGRAAKL